MIDIVDAPIYNLGHVGKAAAHDPLKELWVVVVGRMVWYTARDLETRKDLHHGYNHNDMPSLWQYNATQVWNRAKRQAKISLPHMWTPKS
jgi:hypothetical protein